MTQYDNTHHLQMIQSELERLRGDVSELKLALREDNREKSWTLQRIRNDAANLNFNVSFYSPFILIAALKYLEADKYIGPVLSFVTTALGIAFNAIIEFSGLSALAVGGWLLGVGVVILMLINDFRNRR